MSVNMSQEDLEIAKKLCDSDPEFKALWDEHAELKDKLRALEEKRFFTAEEEVEVKKIKRLKLMGKDKIAMKISEYKVNVLSPG